MISGSLISGETFLSGIRRLQDRTEHTQRQISSGYRIQTAADSPGEVPDLIHLNSALNAVRHYSRTLGRASAEVSAADSALTTAVKITDQARGIALRAAATTTTTAERRNLATQVNSLRQQLVNLSNTTAEGRYIFGGSADQSPPYQFSTSGITRLTTQVGGRVIEDPSGSQVFAGDTASNIFDHTDTNGNPASDNVFFAFDSLLNALNGDDATGAAAALTRIQASADWLNERQGIYGVAGTRITSETDAAASLATALESRISAIRDTDLVQAATDLALENTAQSAAFSAQASVPRKSLFDYLG
jgi:flagellar hook-associated protein 3 FlgL